MAKFTLAQTLRAKDILLQDMKSLSAQIEKLDLQKAIFEEQVVALYEQASQPLAAAAPQPAAALAAEKDEVAPGPVSVPSVETEKEVGN